MNKSNAYGISQGDVTRKRWDKEEYEKKAQERETAMRDKELEEEAKRQGKSLKKDEPEKPLVNLQARPDKVEFEPLVGKTHVVQAAGSRNRQPGFYCSVCDQVMKDNVAYLDHINGKKHQVNMGVNLTIQRATLEQVRARLVLLKRKKEQVPQEYDLDARIAAAKEQEEREKEERKARKKLEKEAKRAEAEIPLDEETQDMAAMMGFGGFGPKKK